MLGVWVLRSLLTMHRYFAHAFLASLGSAAWLASCQSLPPTKPLVSAGTAGASAGNTGDAGTGGTAATAGTGTGGSGKGGSSTGGTTGGSLGTTGGTTQGGTGGSGEGGADDGGADSGGSSGKGGGSGSGGSSGKGGSAGKGGSGGAGAGGTGGRSYSTDPTTFFGDSRCTSDLDFCEDFEDASLNTQRWRIQSGAGDPAVETVRAARGMRSVHFHTEDNGLALLHTTEPFPAPNNRYYGRLFVWFDSVPTAPEWALWTVAASLTEEDESESRVGGQYDNTINRFGISTNYGPTGDWARLDEDPGDPVPIRTWVCIEWLHDGENDVTDLWWDGVPRPSLHTTATEHGGASGEYRLSNIDSMFIGFWVYQAMTMPDHFDVWIDEVATDAERIGCNN